MWGHKLPDLATKSATEVAVKRAADSAVDVGHKLANHATQLAIDAAIKVAVLEERVRWLEVDRARLSHEVEAWKNLWVSTITEGRGRIPISRALLERLADSLGISAAVIVHNFY